MLANDFSLVIILDRWSWAFFLWVRQYDVGCQIMGPERSWQASSPQTGPFSLLSWPAGWAEWAGHYWLWGVVEMTGGKCLERKVQTWEKENISFRKTIGMWFISVKLHNSQRQVLGFLSHNADTALFGQHGRVLFTDALVEEHVSVPVASPHVWIWVSYRKNRAWHLSANGLLKIQLSRVSGQRDLDIHWS